MEVLSRLASANSRKDEELNIALAIEIVEKNNKQAVDDLIKGANGKGSALQNDCIKVLYEIGERAPALIVGHLGEFVALLGHKNNRLQWGAMTALFTISKKYPNDVSSFLVKILEAAHSGSVITLDNAVNILIELCKVGDKDIYQSSFKELIKIIASAPENQVAMYAERSLEVISDKNKAGFGEVVTRRLQEIEKEPKRKRLEKLLLKIDKK